MGLSDSTAMLPRASQLSGECGCQGEETPLPCGWLGSSAMRKDIYSAELMPLRQAEFAQRNSDAER